MLFRTEPTSTEAAPRAATTEPLRVLLTSNGGQSAEPSWTKDASPEGFVERESHQRCRAERSAAHTDGPRPGALALVELTAQDCCAGPSGEELSERRRRPQNRPAQVALAPRNRRSVHHA